MATSPSTSSSAAAAPPSDTLGITMTLPRGTSSQLGSQREDELLRRQQQAKATTIPRRLAPRRRKTTVNERKQPNVSYRAERGICLPIDTPPGRDDDGGAIVVFHDGELRSVDEGSRNNGNVRSRNVADFTATGITKKVETQSEAAGGEYHGEIESMASHRDSDEEEGDMSEQDDITEQGEDSLFQIRSENDISLSPPPPTQPLILVDLLSLTGCPPANKEEKNILVTQLLHALLGSGEDHQRGEWDKSCKSKLQLHSLDFDERVLELFDSGVARHVDSSHPIARLLYLSQEEETEIGHSITVMDNEPAWQEMNRYAIVPYPEFLSAGDSGSSRSTLRLWKLLHTLPIKEQRALNDGAEIIDLAIYTPLLNRLFNHLRNTSRSLLWKADMHKELSILTRAEHLARIQGLKQREYNEWKNKVRKERLEKLYDVRETFMLQVEVARKKYMSLAEDTEVRVVRELKRRGLYGRRRGKDEIVQQTMEESDNYESGCPDSKADNDDGWGEATLREEDIIGEDEPALTVTLPTEDDKEDVCDNDEWSPLQVKANPLGMSIVLDGIKSKSGTGADSSSAINRQESLSKDKESLASKLEPISHNDNLKRKTQRVEKQIQQQQLAGPEDTYCDKYLEQQEESIREMLRTNEERIAQAAHLKLQERLSNVDDLLESLQEEEWADEEEDEECSINANCDLDGNDLDEAEDTLLLDQILAMILGSLPKEAVYGKEANHSASKKDEGEVEHYRFIIEEHKLIVKEWKKVFGRLPRIPPSPAEQEEEGRLFDKGAVDLEEEPLLWSVGEKYDAGSRIGGSIAELRKELNIVDNVDSNWDNAEDSDDLVL